MACVYIDIKRLRRGYYEAEYQLMTATPKDEPDLSITTDYFRRLEQSIQRQPAFWLWTHNRWKRTYEEYERRLDPTTGKVRL
jgi:KDO2-lipid IV(A) lauroyltransferase